MINLIPSELIVETKEELLEYPTKEELIRYFQEFPEERDFNVYVWGVAPCSYYHEIISLFNKYGLDIKELPTEQIGAIYKEVVRQAVLEIVFS